MRQRGSSFIEILMMAAALFAICASVVVFYNHAKAPALWNQQTLKPKIDALSIRQDQKDLLFSKVSPIGMTLSRCAAVEQRFFADINNMSENDRVKIQEVIAGCKMSSVQKFAAADMRMVSTGNPRMPSREAVYTPVSRSVQLARYRVLMELGFEIPEEEKATVQGLDFESAIGRL